MLLTELADTECPLYVGCDLRKPAQDTQNRLATLTLTSRCHQNNTAVVMGAIHAPPPDSELITYASMGQAASGAFQLHCGPCH